MPGRVSEALASWARRGRWTLRTVVLAALLASSTTLLSAGVASADFWPHGEQAAPVTAGHHR